MRMMVFFLISRELIENKKIQGSLDSQNDVERAEEMETESKTKTKKQEKKELQEECSKRKLQGSKDIEIMKKRIKAHDELMSEGIVTSPTLSTSTVTSETPTVTSEKMYHFLLLQFSETKAIEQVPTRNTLHLKFKHRTTPSNYVSFFT
jgi:hypothetical protein